MRNRTFLILVVALFFNTSAGAQTFGLKKPSDGTVAVAIKGAILAWEVAPDRTSYTVEVSKDDQFTTPVTLEDATVEVDLSETGNGEFELPELDPDTTYFWRVIANCPAATPACSPLTSEVRTFITKRRLVSASGDWKFTKTTQGEDATEPAKFAFVRALDEDTGKNDDTYSADFALQWKPKERVSNDRRFYTPTAYLEAVLNDQNDAADTAIRIGGGVAQVMTLSPSSALVSDYVLKLEGDQSFETRKVFAEASMTHADSRRGNRKPGQVARWLWEPTFIAAFGRTIEPGDSAEIDETLFRLGGRIDVKILPDALSRALNVQTVITLSDLFYYLPQEEDNRHNLFSAAFDVEVAEGVTFGLEFKHGKEAPEFKRSHSLGLALGIKF